MRRSVYNSVEMALMEIHRNRPQYIPLFLCYLDADEFTSEKQ